MKASKKRGFTIIELVIVIAVIAILAAVLIPVFSNIIQQAKEANDTVLVRNLNSALKMDVTTDHKTMQQALDAVAEGGFDLTKIKATASDSKLLWDSKNDCFVYLKKDATEPTYIPDTKKENTAAADYWEIVTDVKSDNAYSQYLNNDSLTSVKVASGFDAGRNTKLDTIELETSANVDVAVNTNGGTLKINAAKATVHHYGLADKVEIEAVAPNSYHEHNYVTSYISIKSGNVVIESGASVSILAVAGNIADITLEQKSGSELFTVVSANGTALEQTNANLKVLDKDTISNKVYTSADELKAVKYGGGDGTTADTAYELYTASHLAAFAKDVNDGKIAEYVYAKLGADINIGNMGWEPIGNAEHPFVGSFDGANHTISGLTNKGYSPAAILFGQTNTAKNQGVAYGFFGVVGDKSGNANDKAMSFKDVTLTNVNISISTSNMVGAFIGADSAAAQGQGGTVNEDLARDVVVENVTVEGKIESTNTSGCTAAGVVGKVYTSGKVTVKNCTNKIDIITIGKSNKVAGIVGFTKNFTELTVEGCINEGDMELDSDVGYVAGIVTYGNNKVVKMTIKDNTNKGNIKSQNGPDKKDYYHNTTYIMCCPSGSFEKGSTIDFTGNKNEGGKITLGSNAPSNFKELLINVIQSGNNGIEWNGKVGVVEDKSAGTIKAV